MTVQQLEQLDQGQGRLGFAVFVRVTRRRQVRLVGGQGLLPADRPAR